MLLTWRLRGSSPAARGQIRNDFRAVLTSPNPLARLHALCVLDAVDALTPELVFAGLRDSEPGVRENAVRIAERFTEAAVIAAAAALVDDADPKVRLQLACSLGAWNTTTAAQALARLAVQDHAEPFLRAAVLSSAVPHVRALCDTVARAGGAALADFTEDLTLLAAGLEQRDALAALLAPTLTAHNASFSGDQLRAFARMLDSLDRAKLPRAALGAKHDALGETFQQAAGIFAFARRTTADEGQPVPLRAAAAHLLCRDPAERPAALITLAAWLDPRQPNELQTEGVRALASSGDGSVPATLLGAWSALLPSARAAATEALLSREPWVIALLEHVLSGDPFPLDPVQRTRLLQHTSRKVRDLAGKALQSAGARAKVMEEFQPALGLAGNAARGRVVFGSRCVACHRLDGLGAEIGPDLKSVAQHPTEKLLASILDPSLDVQPGFAAYQCRLSSGEELYGLVTAETANSITFRGTDGMVRLVSRRDIAELKGGAKSLMPDGLEAGLTPRDLADLIQFLRSGGAGGGGKEK
jgi:putative heme-binding domain-containing protein